MIEMAFQSDRHRQIVADAKQLRGLGRRLASIRLPLASPSHPDASGHPALGQSVSKSQVIAP